MEWILGPALIAVYGLSYAYTILCYFEKTRRPTVRPRPEWVVSVLENLRNHPELLQRRGRRREKVDWKKEGF
jgi:hypothetical protein